MIEDFQLFPDPRDYGVALVGVPAINGRMRCDHSEDVFERTTEESFRVLDLDFLVGCRPIFSGIVWALSRVID